MDDAQYEALRIKAFELAQPSVTKDDIDEARRTRRMALSLRVSADVFGDEIRHAVLKIALPDGSAQTVLFDPVAARVLSEQLSRLLDLGWRADALRAKGPPQ